MKYSRLFEKVYGSVAASNIGSAMGAAVEWVSVPGGGWKALEEHFGWVDDFVSWIQKERGVRYWNCSPKLHYKHMDMLSGMTEDGAEIRYLLALTIIEKQGRISVEDLADVWRREIKREDIGRLVNPHIVIHLDRLNAGDETTRISPRLVGVMTPWPGLVDAPHMIGPVGIINAGDPRQAAWDTQEICLLMQPPVGGGVESSKAIAAATAAAFVPDASVDSIVDASIRHLTSHGREIIEETLEIARKYPDIKDIREPIRQHFMPTYLYADGIETAAEVMALFYITKGDVRDCMIGATNLGRDTDCIGDMLGSICGAYKGIDGVPAEWVETCQKAIDANRYTVQKISMEETALGLTKALTASAKKMQDQIGMLTSIGLEL